MGPEFFQTYMGRAYYEGTMPRIAKALERIAAALEEANKRAAIPAAQDNNNNRSKETADV